MRVNDLKLNFAAGQEVEPQPMHTAHANMHNVKALRQGFHICLLFLKLDANSCHDVCA